MGVETPRYGDGDGEARSDDGSAIGGAAEGVVAEDAVERGEARTLGGDAGGLKGQGGMTERDG